MMPISKPIMLVFDLDDTLYSEREYQHSGIAYLMKFFGKWLPSEVELSVCELINNSRPIDALFERLSLPNSVKQSMLWMYRLHKPDIALYPEARELIDYCGRKNIDIAILTDGRAATQLLKIDALGLAHVKSYISEEYDDAKPGSKRFHQIQSDFPAKRYVYIGDNPNKDFIAPNALGWTTVGLRYCSGNIHTYDESKLTAIQSPTVWVDKVSEVVQIILEADI